MSLLFTVRLNPTSGIDRQILVVNEVNHDSGLTYNQEFTLPADAAEKQISAEPNSDVRVALFYEKDGVRSAPAVTSFVAQYFPVRTPSGFGEITCDGQAEIDRTPQIVSPVVPETPLELALQPADPDPAPLEVKLEPVAPAPEPAPAPAEPEVVPAP